MVDPLFGGAQLNGTLLRSLSERSHEKKKGLVNKNSKKKEGTTKILVPK